jgi:hypothetical protein
MKQQTEFFEISTPCGGCDYRMFLKLFNQGIDAHLEAFCKSTSTVRNGRIIWGIHSSEMHILLRRLRELGTEYADCWADDIENYEGESCA